MPWVLKKQRKEPPEAVWNKLGMDCPLEILANLNLLISRRILFKKVTIMPKGRFPKLKGSICNIPIETDNITNILPHGADSNGLVVVKLKRKMSYRGHVYFEAVRPESLHQALIFLKENNSLYSDIDISLENIPNDLVSFSDDNHTEPESPDTLEEDENPLDLNMFNSQKTMFVSDISTAEEINIAPGEGIAKFNTNRSLLRRTCFSMSIS